MFLYKCNICRKEFVTGRSATNSRMLNRHLIEFHNISLKDYYDTYVVESKEHKCMVPNCNKETEFISIVEGYNKTCSTKCSLYYHHSIAGTYDKQKEAARNSITLLNSDPNFKKMISELAIKRNSDPNDNFGRFPGLEACSRGGFNKKCTEEEIKMRSTRASKMNSDKNSNFGRTGKLHKYKDIRMSGPEVRFAKLCDYFNIKWEYEPESFVVDYVAEGESRRSYTPDFFLPDLNLWIEIKWRETSLTPWYQGLFKKFLEVTDNKIIGLSLGNFDNFFRTIETQVVRL